MKVRNEYSQEFKRMVVKSYYQSDASLDQIAQQFNVTSGKLVQKWLRIFEDEFNPLKMKTKKTGQGPVSKTSSEELELRLKELEQALEREKLRSFSLDKMIEVAERDLNINIRKKSGARQSGK